MSYHDEPDFHLESDYEDKYTLQNDIDAEDEDFYETHNLPETDISDNEDEPDYIRPYPHRFDITQEE